MVGHDGNYKVWYRDKRYINLIKFRLTVPLTDHCHTWLHMTEPPVKAAVT